MAKGFPEQDDCDPAVPEEHFLWALSQIPYGPKQTQPIQSNIARVISKHLHELGFRHHPKLQTKRLHLPQRGQKSSLNGSATWGPMDGSEAPEPIEDALPNVDSMTKEERALIDKELEKYREEPAPKPKGAAKETSWKEVQNRHVKKASEVIANGTDPGAGTT